MTFWRISLTTFYLVLFVHCDACVYYKISSVQDHKTAWGLNLTIKYELELNSTSQRTHDYFQCVYWSFMTSLLISGRNKPSTSLEFSLHFTNYMCGLLLTSVIIGQIQDVTKQTSVHREKYRKNYNDCMAVLNRLKVSEAIKEKVGLWFWYEWQTNKKLERNSIQKFLNSELQYDISLQTACVPLRRARLFRNCTDQCMVDLTKIMRPVLYTPGQHICVEHHVGSKMFIVSEGTVLRPGSSRTNSFRKDKTKPSFYSGCVYPDSFEPKYSWIPTIGEEVMLKANARYRHTYVSKGYVRLFVLKNRDLLTVLKDYPEAEQDMVRQLKFSEMGPKIEIEIVPPSCENTIVNINEIEKSNS